MEDGNFVERLILEVEANQCIYNKRHIDYKNRVIKTIAWEGISQILNVSIEGCKAKWKNLRDTFFQMMRQAKNIPSGSGPIKKLKWPYYDSLKFLVAFFDTPRTVTNTISDLAANVSFDLTASKSNSKETRGLKESKQSTHLLEDKMLEVLEKDLEGGNSRPSDAKLFLDSLVKRLENFSEQKRSLIEMKILELFHYVEYDITDENNVEYSLL